MKELIADPGLDEIVRLLQSYEPERIILFGSRARGDADEYSDYDVIVIKRTARPFLERLRDMVPYLVAFGRPAEILVYTPDEFEQMRDTGLGWLVRREGVTLYERPSD
jgi:predicted nucleotidyltransferase